MKSCLGFASACALHSGHFDPHRERQSWNAEIN
jgi:hypothetical protein